MNRPEGLESMRTDLQTKLMPDEAAILGAAMSLYEVCKTKSTRLELSQHYNGDDQIMRLCMAVARTFETWACVHVAFDEMEDVWPYLLHDTFGDAVDIAMGLMNLDNFTETHCKVVAAAMELPVWTDQSQTDKPTDSGEARLSQTDKEN